MPERSGVNEVQIGDFDLTDRVALVTGGGRGLGYHMSQGLLKAGATVVIVDKNEDLVANVASKQRSMADRVMAFACDVTDQSQVENVFGDVIKKYGRLDILVNNAGINIRKPILDLTAEDFESVFRVNVIGAFHCAKAAHVAMKRSGYGKIVNIASLAGVRVLRGTEMSPYYVSKAGLINFTRAAAAEWASSGIRVNSISPGWFVTDLNKHVWENEAVARIRMEQTPMGRVGQPEELVGTVVYLSASASDYVTGQNIIVDGGYCVW